MRKSTIVAVLAAAFIAPAIHAADVTEADYQKAMKEVLGECRPRARPSVRPAT